MAPTLVIGKAPAPAPACIKSVVSIAPKQTSKSPFRQSIRTLKRWKARLSGTTRSIEYSDGDKSLDLAGFVQLEEQLEHLGDDKRASCYSQLSSDSSPGKQQEEQQDWKHASLLMALFTHTKVEQVSQSTHTDTHRVKTDDAFNRRCFDELRASHHERL